MALDGITVNKQSSIRMEAKGGALYFDPLGIDGEPHDAAAIFITHDHFDHFSVEDIAKVAKADTRLVVPKKMAQAAEQKSGIAKENIIEVEPGQDVEMPKGYHVRTVPAYNNAKPFHPKGAGWCGYLLTLEGKTYYVAGDTDDTPDNRKVSCDVAFVPIGGTYTMNAKEAAGLVNAIRPSVAVPIHYGEVVGNRKDAEAFRKLVDGGIEVVILL